MALGMFTGMKNEIFKNIVYKKTIKKHSNTDSQSLNILGIHAWMELRHIEQVYYLVKEKVI